MTSALKSRLFFQFCILSFSILLLPTAYLLYHRLPFTYNGSSLPLLRYETISVRDFAQRQQPQHRDSFEKQFTAFTKLVITDYVAKHRALRAACDANLSIAATTRLLVYRGQNRNFGLGDRARGALSAYLFSVMTDRLFLIDLPQPFPIQTMWTSPPNSNFTFDPSIFPVDEVNGEASDVRVIRKNLPDMAGHRCPHVRVIVQRFMPNVSPRRTLAAARFFPAFHEKLRKIGLEGFSPGRDDLAPLLLQTVFRPTTRLRNAIRRQRPFGDREYLSLHARLGVGLGEIGGWFNPTQRGMTLMEMANCLGRIGGRVAREYKLRRVFIATDTRQANEALREGVWQTFPGAKVIWAHGRVVHLRWLRRRKLSGEDFENFERVFVEAGLLGGGRNIVFLKSGFADIGLWIGAMRGHRMIKMNFCIKEKEEFMRNKLGNSTSIGDHTRSLLA